MAEIQWRSSDTPASPDELERLQNYWKVRFPADFLDCLGEHNGGAPTPYYVTTASGEDETFDHLLSVTPGSRDHIVLVAAGLFEYLPLGVLPFAEDGAGNYFVFDFRQDPEHPTVAFVFHEGFRLTPVANSFTELLEKLHDNPPWDEDEEEED